MLYLSTGERMVLGRVEVLWAYGYGYVVLSDYRLVRSGVCRIDVNITRANFLAWGSFDFPDFMVYDSEGSSSAAPLDNGLTRQQIGRLKKYSPSSNIGSQAFDHLSVVPSS